eukprot:4535962-Ditylum_brightwellii.AAC.1
MTATTMQNNYCYSAFVIEDGRNRQENSVFNSPQNSSKPPYTIGYNQKQPNTTENKQCGNSPRHPPFPG